MRGSAQIARRMSSRNRPPGIGTRIQRRGRKGRRSVVRCVSRRERHARVDRSRCCCGRRWERHWNEFRGRRGRRRQRSGVGSIPSVPIGERRRRRHGTIVGHSQGGIRGVPGRAGSREGSGKFALRRCVSRMDGNASPKEATGGPRFQLVAEHRAGHRIARRARRGPRVCSRRRRPRERGVGWIVASLGSAAGVVLRFFHLLHWRHVQQSTGQSQERRRTWRRRRRNGSFCGHGRAVRAFPFWSWWKDGETSGCFVCSRY
mmetsp:Transcript_37913/g.64770  ORF Transcript_37913/g.64770 Transcript_37913/m.64770 type:complete len:260 (+) Transcript_37913:453-1232(+)